LKMSEFKRLTKEEIFRSQPQTSLPGHSDLGEALEAAYTEIDRLMLDNVQKQCRIEELEIAICSEIQNLKNAIK
jgi:hypothetical protein